MLEIAKNVVQKLLQNLVWFIYLFIIFLKPSKARLMLLMLLMLLTLRSC